MNRSHLTYSTVDTYEERLTLKEANGCLDKTRRS